MSEEINLESDNNDYGGRYGDKYFSELDDENDETDDSNEKDPVTEATIYIKSRKFKAILKEVNLESDEVPMDNGRIVFQKKDHLSVYPIICDTGKSPVIQFYKNKEQ
ncbi:MAG: hypothetical protein EZS28_026174 [Streblomastix strix]|uniref:Uncharacterized protein n=1 Tax=Streblomastix strix TaxID=222440 RepID=A0A5J4V7R6_9EUKA|nr:MAG: hypothetical protein EZS28_026174 [Streblomastix strix]